LTGFVFNHRSPEPEKNLTARLLQILGLGQEEIIAMGQRAQVKAGEFEIEKVAFRYLEDFETVRCGRPNEQRESALALNK
jgi:hypothetical protein